MWAAGVIDLGLTSPAFWDLTPHEFDLLFNRHLDREDRANRRAAMIAVQVINMAGKTRTGKPLTVDDMLGVSPGNHQPTDMERMREQLDPVRAANRYLEDLRASDPQSEITMAKAVLDAVAARQGEWIKLGTREGLLESASVQAMMRGELK